MSNYSGQVDPLSFLEKYLKEGINHPNRLGDSRDQELLLAQISPRMVRNVYTGMQGNPYIITPEDKLNMMKDYEGVIEHDAPTLREIFAPILAP